MLLPENPSYVTLQKTVGISTRYMPVLMRYVNEDYRIAATGEKAAKETAQLAAEAWAKKLGVEYR